MNLQNMAPNAKRSLLVTLVFGAIAATLYFFAIESTEATLAKTRRTLQDRTLKHRTMTANLSRADAVTKDLDDDRRRLAAYEQETPIALPILGAAAREQYVRCPIKITCRGSYQAAISFVQCVERRFPLAALGALTISAGSDPDLQLVSIILEWPMKKGAVK